LDINPDILFQDYYPGRNTRLFHNIKIIHANVFFAYSRFSLRIMIRGFAREIGYAAAICSPAFSKTFNWYLLVPLRYACGLRALL